MQTHKKIIILVSIITVAVICGISIYLDIRNFFTIPLYAMINILVAVVFVFYFSQLKNDERKQKEMTEHLISRLLNSLDNKNWYKIKTQDELDFIRLDQRTIFSRLTLLKDKSIFKQKKDTEDIDYMLKEFRNYWDLVSDNINNLESFGGLENQLYRHISNIINKLEELNLKIY